MSLPKAGSRAAGLIRYPTPPAARPFPPESAVIRPLAVALAAAAAVLVADPGAARDGKAKTGFVTKTFTNADGSKSPYVVFVPHDYDGSKAVPVILFLHGAGETKGGGKMPAEVGIGPAIKKREKTFPFLTVIPQSEKRTWKADSDDGKRALAILDEVTKSYKTDPKQTYLTGLSMGGFGTWSIAAAHPEKWAAIVPICGGGNTAAAEKIKGIPAWVFHGDKDTAVPVDLSRKMVEALKTGVNKGLEDVAELGRELEKAALKAGYGSTISPASLEKLVTAGVSAKEVAFVKRYLVRSHAFEIDTPQKRMHQALDTHLLGLPADYHTGYVPKVLATSQEAVNAALARRIHTKDLGIVVVGTAKEIRDDLEKAIPDLARVSVVPFDAD